VRSGRSSTLRPKRRCPTSPQHARFGSSSRSSSVTTSPRGPPRAASATLPTRSLPGRRRLGREIAYAQPRARADVASLTRSFRRWVVRRHRLVRASPMRCYRRTASSEWAHHGRCPCARKNRSRSLSVLARLGPAPRQLSRPGSSRVLQGKGLVLKVGPRERAARERFVLRELGTRLPLGLPALVDAGPGWLLLQSEEIVEPRELASWRAACLSDRTSARDLRGRSTPQRSTTPRRDRVRTAGPPPRCR
jgi:hypothetical protein